MRNHLLTVVYSLILSAIVPAVGAVAQIAQSGQVQPAVLVTVWVSAFVAKLILGLLMLYHPSPDQQAADARFADTLQQLLMSIAGPLFANMLAPKPMTPIHPVPAQPAGPAPTQAHQPAPQVPPVAPAPREPAPQTNPAPTSPDLSTLPATSTDTLTHP